MGRLKIDVVDPALCHALRITKFLVFVLVVFFAKRVDVLILEPVVVVRLWPD